MTEAALRRTILHGLLVGLYQSPDTKHSYHFNHWSRSHRPPTPAAGMCNSFAFTLNVMKLTFWDRLGIRAVRTLFRDYEKPRQRFMDLWIFWKAQTEREQRELVLAARHEREWRCRECRRRMP